MDVLSGYSYSLLFGSGEKYTPKYHNQPFSYRIFLLFKMNYFAYEVKLLLEIFIRLEVAK